MSRKRLLVPSPHCLLASAPPVAARRDEETVTKTVTVGGTTTTRAPRRPVKKVNIIASVPPTDHGWLGALSKNAKAAAAKHDDVRFELLQAADADSQAQQIEQVIRRSPTPSSSCPRTGRADAGGPEGRGAGHPGRQHRPALHRAGCARRRRSSATTTRSACTRPSTSPTS